MSRIQLAANCACFNVAFMQRETDLYGPIKALLEGQGYIVKGEVGAADLVACRDGDEPVIVELKLRFSLALFHQAVARLAITDLVYVAVERPGGKPARRALKDNLAMCRRLGLGLITVRGRDGYVEVLADPVPYSPRKSARKRSRLLREFQRISGDPNTGGDTRGGIVTGYRQDALRCAAYLQQSGPARGAEVCRATGVGAATRIMADNHHGWFDRVSRGVYALTAEGDQGLKTWAAAVPEPAPEPDPAADPEDQSGEAISSRK